MQVFSNMSASLFLVPYVKVIQQSVNDPTPFYSYWATGLLGNYLNQYFFFFFFFFLKKTFTKKALDKLNFFTLVYINYMLC